VRYRAGLSGRLSLNSFIQTRQVYTYEIPMGNRVRIIASQTYTRLPNGWRFCPISIPMGTIFVSYPYPNRRIPHGLAGIGSPLTSLAAILFDLRRPVQPRLRHHRAHSRRCRSRYTASRATVGDLEHNDFFVLLLLEPNTRLRE
jgi:hypothetical protein